MKVTNCNQSTRNHPQRQFKKLKDLEIRGPSRLQHYEDCQEYCAESWRLEETCYISDSSERPSAPGVKNSPEVIRADKKTRWRICKS